MATSISSVPKTAPRRPYEEPSTAYPGWFISLAMSSNGRTRVLCLQLLVTLHTNTQLLPARGTSGRVSSLQGGRVSGEVLTQWAGPKVTGGFPDQVD